MLLELDTACINVWTENINLVIQIQEKCFSPTCRCGWNEQDFTVSKFKASFWEIVMLLDNYAQVALSVDFENDIFL